MRSNHRARFLAGAFAVTLALAGCGGDDDGGGGETGGDGGTGGAPAITIEGIAFHPASLQVTGTETITITNNDGTTHTFTLDDGSVDEELTGGSSVEVTLDISETTGFHCEIHSSMTGTLEVA